MAKIKCSHCGYGEITVPEIETTDSLWNVCPECGAIQLFYDPQDYQIEFHKDNHMIKGLFGGLAI